MHFLQIILGMFTTAFRESRSYRRQNFSGGSNTEVKHNGGPQFKKSSNIHCSQNILPSHGKSVPTNEIDFEIAAKFEVT